MVTSRWKRYNSRSGEDMMSFRPVQVLNHTSLNGQIGLCGPVWKNDAMQKPHTAVLAKVALDRVTSVAWPLVHADFGSEMVGRWPHSFRWVDGRGTKCGGGLFPALETVAD
jgi:hypothetical protein